MELILKNYALEIISSDEGHHHFFCFTISTIFFVLDVWKRRLHLSAWCVRVVHVWQGAERTRGSQWRCNECPRFSRHLKIPISLDRPHSNELGAKMGHSVGVGD